MRARYFLLGLLFGLLLAPASGREISRRLRDQLAFLLDALLRLLAARHEPQPVQRTLTAL
jgi:hypothetical protein